MMLLRLHIVMYVMLRFGKLLFASTDLDVCKLTNIYCTQFMKQISIYQRTVKNIIVLHFETGIKCLHKHTEWL